MRPNPQFSADLVSFTEEILNGKLHFFCSAILAKRFIHMFERFLNTSLPDFCTLPKISKFHLIFCSGNFVETHSFDKVSGELPETPQKLCVSKKFYTRKLGEITAFYAMVKTS